MTLDQLRALADEFFEWPIAHNKSTVTMTSALLFAQHVLQLREKSLGTENKAGVYALREAAQRQLDALAAYRREIGLLTGVYEQPCDAEVALRAALAQQAEPTGKKSLQVESVVAENATTQQQIEQTPPSEYRRGYWAGFAIGKREGRIEAEDALAQQAEPAQEPVAWVECDGALVWNNREAAIGRNLYTAPQPQRPPVTKGLPRKLPEDNDE